MSLDIEWGDVDNKNSLGLISIKGTIKNTKSKLEEIPNEIRRKEKRIFQQIKNPIFNFIWTHGLLGSEKDIKKRIEKEFKNDSHKPSYYEYVKELVNNLDLKILIIVAEGCKINRFEIKSGEFKITLNVESGLVKEFNKKKTPVKQIRR